MHEMQFQGPEIAEILKEKQPHLGGHSTIALGFSAAVKSWKMITTVTSKLNMKIFFQPKIVHSAILSIKYESEIRVSPVIWHLSKLCRNRKAGVGAGEGSWHWVICPWSSWSRWAVSWEEEEEALVEQLLKVWVQDPLGVLGPPAACTMLVQGREVRAHFDPALGKSNEQGKS